MPQSDCESPFTNRHIFDGRHRQGSLHDAATTDEVKQAHIRLWRISILKRLIADYDCIAAELDQEIQREEDRVRIHDRAHFAYSTYARATTLRRDNLRRSADELRTHLAKAQKALIELGDATLDA